jgi:hypothetical protein
LGTSAVTTTSTCAICGTAIETRIPPDWHPSHLARRAEEDLDSHLQTHSLAEVLRHEIRQDLNQVPEAERATIIRDIYRNLLGTSDGDFYSLNDSDRLGVYSIDEALGSLNLIQLWRSANRCSKSSCAHS